jgi:hypothetical protein
MRLEDAHEAAGGLWAEFWALFTDPAHAMAELAMSVIWDVVIITLIYQLLIKRWLYPRWSNKVHHEIDAEHGVDHHAASQSTGWSNHVRVTSPAASSDADSDAHGGTG